MNSEPELNTKAEQADIDWIFERMPHVPAWCYRADGLLLPLGQSGTKCTSDSCHDYRVAAAGRLYEAGLRPPIKIGNFLKKLPEPVVVG